jgi:integrase
VKKVSINDFLRQFESQSTKNSYQSSFKQFFRLIYPEVDHNTLNEKSLQYLSENHDYQADIIRYRESLESKAPMTVVVRLSAIRTYLEENGIEFSKRFFKRVGGRRTEAISEEKVPTNEELRRIVEYMPLQGKAVTLLLSSSGMRLNEALSLRVDDIDFNSSPVRIKVRGENTKTKKTRITFMSQESKEAVKEWLNFKPQYIEQADGRSAHYLRNYDVNLLFPFTSANFEALWTNTLTKAQMNERDPQTRRLLYRPHNLRKFFITAVRHSGIDEAECMAGHQTGLAKIYADVNNKSDAEKKLAETYRKAEPELSIYKQTAEITKLQIQVNEGDRKIDQLIRNLSVENAELKEKLNGLERRYDNFAKWMEQPPQRLDATSDLLFFMKDLSVDQIRETRALVETIGKRNWDEADIEAKEEAMKHMPPMTKEDLEHAREVLARRKEAREK